ncbi:MAG: DUF4054 domain-containing protein [Novosphingobium sp.]|nr:DUF4054 domain-containing protein [Novosphingobium sp.]
MAYTKPTAANLKARFPAFAAVADGTVEYWINEGDEQTATWPETGRDKAVMAYAAHRMAELGIGSTSIPVGLTSFKSGTFSATVSDSVAGLTGMDATVYGREFVTLRRVAFAGPRMAWTPPTALD